MGSRYFGQGFERLCVAGVQTCGLKRLTDSKDVQGVADVHLGLSSTSRALIYLHTHENRLLQRGWLRDAC